MWKTEKLLREAIRGFLSPEALMKVVKLLENTTDKEVLVLHSTLIDVLINTVGVAEYRKLRKKLRHL